MRCIHLLFECGEIGVCRGRAHIIDERQMLGDVLGSPIAEEHVQ